MKKTMFVFTVDNTIDLITNSSSELFVLQGDSKELVIEMIKSTYPNYLTEYEEVKSIDELSNRELDTYIGIEYNSWSNSKQETETNLIPGFTFDEMYESPEWAKGNSHRGDRYFTRDVTDETREKYINGISPKKDMYFLFSIDENPEWEEQEKLELISTRYHLG